jgi:sugar lactone lactonase YvrE
MVSAIVSGLSGIGLVLQSNGTDLPINVNGSVTLQSGVSTGASYDLSVKTQPTSPWQTCAVVGGAGTVAAANVALAVNCATNTYAVGGTVSGLTGQALALRNAGKTVHVDANGAFAFSGAAAVASGAQYSIDVQEQPVARSHICSVTNGSGSVANAAVTNVHVACVGTQLGVLAGRIGGQGRRDGVGLDARFTAPWAVAADAAGNLYVTDYMKVRKVTPSGTVTTVAGVHVQGSDDGQGAAARFFVPLGITVDSAGTMFVADSSNQTIRKITPAGDVTTYAGAAGQSGAVNANGAAARFNQPAGIAVDAAGNVYVGERGSHTIRKITPSRDVTTLAGVATMTGLRNGPGATALFNNPTALAVDGGGNVYVADQDNHSIRKVAPNGEVTTLAGSGTAGPEDGPGTQARFSFPRGITINTGGTLYVSDTGSGRVRAVTSAGNVTTIAGSFANQGYADGAGDAARFSNAYSIAVNAAGDLFVADTGNVSLRKIVGNVVSTLAGRGVSFGANDGRASEARFSGPQGLAVAADGTLYVADGNGGTTIRRISATGDVSTLAGSYAQRADSDGAGANARFNFAINIALAPNGTLYAADWQSHTIRMITPTGVVSTIAGAVGQPGYQDAIVGSAARFKEPGGVAVDSAGNVYVADFLNAVIRRITPAGVVDTFAGTPGAPGINDGPLGVGRLVLPWGLAIDRTAQKLYVADRSGMIRFVDLSSGSLGTLAGAPGGPSFVEPYALALDAATGNVYVADKNGGKVLQVTSAGVVTTIAGEGFISGVVPGSLPGSVSSPQGIVVLPEFPSVLAVSDTSENAVLHIAIP